MFTVKLKQKIQAAVLLLIAAGVVYASVTGPEARYTGAPGDINSCYACHDTNLPNSGQGSINIGGVPATYQPGQQYTLTVTVQQAARQRYGFQLTVIDTDRARAGQLASLGGDTQINSVTGAGDRQYIQHTSAGTLPNGQSSRTWQFRWTAPATDVGTVEFYASGNAANGNGTNQGDFIYTTTARTESPTSNVTVSLETRPDGLALSPGSTYRISWAVTNPSNVDNIELRYSIDDGATFPVGNLIATILDPAVTSFDWVVPDTPTTQARVRITVGTKSGAAVTPIISGRFTIGSGGGPSLFNVTGISISGKKLFVTGNGFKQDAKVEINGESQKTSNDDELGQRLKCKKAGKKLVPGSTYDIRVRNPDGSITAEFLYTRPSEG